MSRSLRFISGHPTFESTGYRGAFGGRAHQHLARARRASLDIVAVDDLRASADRAFERDPAGMCAYGTSPGYTRLLEWLSKKHDVEPNRIVATNGSMQADAFLFNQLVQPGVVVVEAPTYDRTLLALRKLGAEILAIPLEADGIDVEALAGALEAGARPARPHHSQLPEPRRLHSLARETPAPARTRREYGFTIFEDDPYVELRFEGEQHPTMLELGGADGNVVYASSFSKTVCPGIRVGYLVGPQPIITAIRKEATETYISPNMVAQAIVAEFCDSGAIDHSIATVKAALHRDATCAALLATCRTLLRGAGGRLRRVDLPGGPTATPLRRRPGARRDVREGNRLPARRRRELTAARLLRRATRPDRGGHRARGGCLPRAGRGGCVNRLTLAQPRDITSLFRDSLRVYVRHAGLFILLSAVVVVPVHLVVEGIGLERLTGSYDPATSDRRDRRPDRRRLPHADHGHLHPRAALDHKRRAAAGEPSARLRLRGFPRPSSSPW